jgi:hypothetical protein
MFPATRSPTVAQPPPAVISRPQPSTAVPPGIHHRFLIASAFAAGYQSRSVVRSIHSIREEGKVWQASEVSSPRSMPMAKTPPCAHGRICCRFRWAASEALLNQRREQPRPGFNDTANPASPRRAIRGAANGLGEPGGHSLDFRRTGEKQRDLVIQEQTAHIEVG